MMARWVVCLHGLAHTQWGIVQRRDLCVRVLSQQDFHISPTAAAQFFNGIWRYIDKMGHAPICQFCMVTVHTGNHQTAEEPIWLLRLLEIGFDQIHMVISFLPEVLTLLTSVFLLPFWS